MTDSSSGTTRSQGFQVLGVRSWADRALVIYSTHLSIGGQSPNYVFGHVLVAKESGGWAGQSSGSTESTVNFPGGSEVCYEVVLGRDNNAAFAIVYGRVPGARVTTVEVEFNNGDRERDKINSEVFGIVSPHNVVPNILRTIGDSDKILYEVSIPGMSGLNPGEVSSSGLTCVP